MEPAFAELDRASTETKQGTGKSSSTLHAESHDRLALRNSLSMRRR